MLTHNWLIIIAFLDTGGMVLSALVMFAHPLILKKFI